jgi:hypothetical protein
MWARVTRASRSLNTAAISRHCCARRRYSSALLAKTAPFRTPKAYGNLNAKRARCIDRNSSLTGRALLPKPTIGPAQIEQTCTGVMARAPLKGAGLQGPARTGLSQTEDKLEGKSQLLTVAALAQSRARVPLVALPPALDLLLFAKHLFVAAKMARMRPTLFGYEALTAAQDAPE